MPSKVTATLLPERCEPIRVVSDPGTRGATCRVAAFNTWLTTAVGVTGAGGGGAGAGLRQHARTGLTSGHSDWLDANLSVGYEEFRYAYSGQCGGHAAFVRSTLSSRIAHFRCLVQLPCFGRPDHSHLRRDEAYANAGRRWAATRPARNEPGRDGAAALAAGGAADRGPGAARPGAGRLPARPALHRLDQVPVRRLSGR